MQTVRNILKIKMISILFQDANYKNNFGVDTNEVTLWMIKLFDIWFEDKDKIFLNPFDMIIHLLLGFEEIGNDGYGELYNNALLILTNGEIQVTGLEKLSKNERTFNIRGNSLDDVFQEKIFRDYYNLHKDDVLCNKCKGCLIRGVCGGGRLAHRYSDLNLFDNPTIYCDTMMQLVVHIQNRLFEKLPTSIIEKTNLQLLNINDL